MSRYIDADKINPMRCPQSIEEMRKWIDEQPTADVVEVVRCENCECRGKTGLRQVYCYVHEKYMAVDDFCSYGERKVQECD